MEFWMIAYRHQPNVFVNLVTEESMDGYSPECFLPSRKLAADYIKKEIPGEDGKDFVVVKVLVHYYENGEMVSKVGPVRDWMLRWRRRQRA